MPHIHAKTHIKCTSMGSTRFNGKMCRYEYYSGVDTNKWASEHDKWKNITIIGVSLIASPKYVSQWPKE